MNEHGGDIYSYDKKMLDFSANINPLGLHKAVKQAAVAAIDRVEQYPDPENRKLRSAVSDKEGVPQDRIICGNGAAELIFNIVTAIKPRKVLIPAPTFSEYEKAADTVNAEKVFYYLSEDRDFCMDDGILSMIDSSVDILFLCNPNNPTGKTIPRDLLIRIADKCAENGVHLVLDECFLDFVDGGKDLSIIPFLQKYEHRLFVLKSFTKMYAMPGIRLGYGMTYDEELLDAIKKNRQPWNVSVVAEEAGIAACVHHEEIETETRLFTGAERKRIMKSLRDFPEDNIKVYDAEANYIFFKAAAVNGGSLEDALLAQQIIIRNCANYRGLGEGYYRIAVRTPEENDMLIRALKVLYGS